MNGEGWERGLGRVGVSLNPEILKCSDGVRTMLPLPDIQRGGNDAGGNTADIENATPCPFTIHRVYGETVYGERERERAEKFSTVQCGRQ